MGWALEVTWLPPWSYFMSKWTFSGSPDHPFPKHEQINQQRWGGLNTNQIYFWDIKGTDQFHDLQTLNHNVRISSIFENTPLVCVSQKLFFFGLVRKHELLNFWEACFVFVGVRKNTLNIRGTFFRHWKFGSPHPLPNPPNPSGIPEGVSLFPDEEEDVEKLYLGTKNCYFEKV